MEKLNQYDVEDILERYQTKVRCAMNCGGKCLDSVIGNCQWKSDALCYKPRKRNDI